MNSSSRIMVSKIEIALIVLSQTPLRVKWNAKYNNESFNAITQIRIGYIPLSFQNRNIYYEEIFYIMNTV